MGVLPEAQRTCVVAEMNARVATQVWSDCLAGAAYLDGTPAIRPLITFLTHSTLAFINCSLLQDTSGRDAPQRGSLSQPHFVWLFGSSAHLLLFTGVARTKSSTLLLLYFAVLIGQRT